MLLVQLQHSDTLKSNTNTFWIWRKFCRHCWTHGMEHITRQHKNSSMCGLIQADTQDMLVSAIFPVELW